VCAVEQAIDDELKENGSQTNNLRNRVDTEISQRQQSRAGIHFGAGIQSEDPFPLRQLDEWNRMIGRLVLLCSNNLILILWTSGVAKKRLYSAMALRYYEAHVGRYYRIRPFKAGRSAFGPFRHRAMRR
jgi:hypothetical protein